MTREEILEYALSAFGAAPEYLWKRYPDHCVLRHAGNRKWFAVLMETPKRSLGMEGEGRLTVLNVKCDPILKGSLLSRPGFLPAYHMNKEHWLSVLPDDAPEDEITALLNMSFEMTR